MTHSVRVHFAERGINDLQEISATLERTINQPDEPGSYRLEALKNVVTGYSNVIISLEDNNRGTILRSPNMPDPRQFIASARPDKNAHASDTFTISDPILQTSKHIHGQKTSSNWRMIRLPVGQLTDGKPAYMLYLALSIDLHLHYINDPKDELIMTASLINTMIVFVVLFAVYKSHELIRNVSRRIQNITSKDLDVRLDPQAVPIELERLASLFNRMIKRIEDVFKRQPNFSADIAHEIHTPITNLITQTEITLSQTHSQKKLEDVLYSDLEKFGRMPKMVSDILFLAWADNSQLIPERKALNLADEVGKVFDFFEAWTGEREVGLRFEERACQVSGDPLMLRRAMNNLLSNAMRCTPEDESVTVRVKEADDQVQIVTENPGNPIPPQHPP